MSTLEEGKRELEDVEAIRFVTGTLLELSAERIKQLREKFEQNQLFYAEISDLYALVKWNAERRDELAKAIPARGKRLSIALTSNSRFYGSLNRHIVDTFVKHIETQENRSFMVIGTVGQRLMEFTPHRNKAVYLSFAGDQPTQSEVHHLLQQLEPYSEVLVYHPQFVNVFLQDVGVLDMTHSAPEVKQQHADVNYLFEPELPRILSFFETRVRYLLFQRAMLESELARTAARLTTMSRAEERAGTEIAQLRTSILKEQQTFDSLSLLESIAGTLKWRVAAKNNL